MTGNSISNQGSNTIFRNTNFPFLPQKTVGSKYDRSELEALGAAKNRTGEDHFPSNTSIQIAPASWTD